VALRAVVADSGYMERWNMAERGHVPAAGRVIQAGNLGVLHELGASMVVVSEIADLTRALTLELPGATAAASAVQWTVAVKHVECMCWLLDVSWQEWITGMGYRGEDLVALRWSLPGDSPMPVWRLR
jgi:hypothetical protein